MELLIVLAVIALLAALLLPVFVTTRDRPRAVTCGANLRQLGIAMQIYADDYDACFPLISWGGGIRSYVGNTQLFVCPDDNNRNRTYKRSALRCWFSKRKAYDDVQYPLKTHGEIRRRSYPSQPYQGKRRYYVVTVVRGAAQPFFIATLPAEAAPLRAPLPRPIYAGYDKRTRQRSVELQTQERALAPGIIYGDG